jgi:hypothetical protein
VFPPIVHDEHVTAPKLHDPFTINTSDGANVISMVISPYNDVSMIDVDALPPKIPNH